MRPPDPRQRYRVAFDEALQRGEVDERLIAKGECEPWNAYLRGAELCERASEEWEWERIARQQRLTNFIGGILEIDFGLRVTNIDYARGIAARVEMANLAAPFVTARDYVRILDTGSMRHLRPSRVPHHVAANRRRLDGRRHAAGR